MRDHQTFASPLGPKKIGQGPVHDLAFNDTLVARCVAGEQPAWRELHKALHPAVAAFLRQLGVKPNEMDDVVQDVFVQVFRYLPRFEGRAELMTWVYKICASQASRQWHRRKIRWALDRVLGGFVAPRTDNFEGDWAGYEARREMETALEKMSHRQRVVFALYELHGLPGEQIARIVGCPPATVRGRLREARQIFARATGALSDEAAR